MLTEVSFSIRAQSLHRELSGEMIAEYEQETKTIKVARREINVFVFVCESV